MNCLLKTSEIEITQQVAQRPSDKMRRELTRTKACVGACAPALEYVCVWWRRLRSFRSQGILGVRRDPSNARGGTAAARVLSKVFAYSAVCLLTPRFLVRSAHRAG